MWQRTDESWFIGRTLVEYGLTDRLDFRVGITPWNIRTETLKDPTGQDSRTRSGVGNVMLGGKWSLLDNDSGSNPLSVVGTINLPTASERLVRHDNLEGGLGGQYERQLPLGFQIRANSSFTLSKSAPSVAGIPVSITGSLFIVNFPTSQICPPMAGLTPGSQPRA